jgi:uncharacterized damage-inducible protein DinB
MKKYFAIALMGICFGISTQAQMTPKNSAKDPLSDWLRSAYDTNRKFIEQSVAQVPEELYGMRPGAQMEVRTFGQIVGHLIYTNYSWCAQAKGEPSPIQGKDYEKVTSKAELVRTLHEAFAYCDGAYAALTDASGMETITLGLAPGRQIQVPRMARLVQNYGHNNEHYGNLVTYMRIKSIVPPSATVR